ncbi:MAG: hypothetical protein V4717_12220 [Bacteroidota bacterium]
MRCCVFLLILLSFFTACSKNKPIRTNFAELTVNGQKFTFDNLEAVFDTSTEQITCNFRFFDNVSNSNMIWETITFSKWINGIYEYPGEQFPGRSIVFLHLQTYLNRFPGSYSLQNTSFKLIIDQSENGRMHGKFSGKLVCYTCNTYGDIVPVTDGEFELPYSYR